MTQPDLFTDGPTYKVAPPYFNTTHLPQPELAKATTEARLQERAVLAIMRGHGKPMGPSAVWRKGVDTLGDSWLLTSVRRAMTNLTRSGKLMKLEEYADGPYGRREHVWMVAP